MVVVIYSTQSRDDNLKIMTYQGILAHQNLNFISFNYIFLQIILFSLLFFFLSVNGLGLV